jgi:hypothetical protein
MPSGSRQRERAAAAVPDRHREHALEVRPDALAPSLEAAQDALGVAAGAEAMAERLERLAQRGVVVDLAVEGDDEAPVVALHRLVAAGQVDDRQAAHAEAEVVLREDALVVRAAVHDGVAHRAHRRRTHGLTLAGVPAGDAAHQAAFLRRSSARS